MALTEYFIDPSIVGNVGAGTVGNPYSNTEHCIATAAQGAEDTCLHIKTGTDDVLTQDLETTLAANAWNLVEGNGLIIKPYVAVANDVPLTSNTRAGISGGGLNFSIINATGNRRYMTFINMHLHNTGSATVVDLDNYSHCTNCEIDDSSGAGLVLGLGGTALHNYVHNIGGTGIQGNTGAQIAWNWLENGANNFNQQAINANGSHCHNNIVIVGGSSWGIALGQYSHVFNNTIFGNGGSGKGFYVPAAQGADFLANNIVEGFNGIGGKGLDYDTATSWIRVNVNNSYYDNTTDFETAPGIDDWINEGNESLTQSAFIDAAAGDFSPVDTGLVKEGSVFPLFFNS